MAMDCARHWPWDIYGEYRCHCLGSLRKWDCVTGGLAPMGAVLGMMGMD